MLFLLWAYTPDDMLKSHGVTYYPSKWWALALPAWASVTVVFLFWLYERWAAGPAPGHTTRTSSRAGCQMRGAPRRLDTTILSNAPGRNAVGELRAALHMCSLCMMSALPPGAPSTLRDQFSKGKEEVGLASYFGGVGKGIPPLVDVPPDLVSMVLHGGLAPQGEVPMGRMVGRRCGM